MKRLLFAAAAAVCVAAGALCPATDADAAALRLFNFHAGAFDNAVTGGAAHYYLTYTLENAGSEARKPPLRIELRTETSKTYGDHAHGATSAAAQKAQDHDAAYKSASEIRSADLGAGAKVDGLAHFGRIDPNADDLEVRVYGLWDPVVRDRKGRAWSERRVMVLKYRRIGDEYNRQDDPIKLVSTSNELEGEPVLLYGGE